MIESKTYTTTEIPVTLPDGHGGLKSYPNLLTEDELIRFLRIPEISKAQDYHNVIAHLKRYRNLPCIHYAANLYIHGRQYSTGYKKQPKGK